MSNPNHLDFERLRLEQDAAREHNWKRFGPYLAERQWVGSPGTELEFAL